MPQYTLPPPPPELPQQRWFQLLYTRVMSTSAGAISWSGIDFTGSNITSIATRNHNDLQNIQGGAPSDMNHLLTQQVQALNSTQVMNWLN